MKEFEKIENQEMIKDQEDVIEELIRIEKYQKELNFNSNYNLEIQEFIKKIINKYRLKIEVNMYYNNTDGHDDINGKQYDILERLKEMILQYSLVKFGEDFYKKLINNNKNLD